MNEKKLQHILYVLIDDNRFDKQKTDYLLEQLEEVFQKKEE